jgi:hypothetical protein
MKVNSLIVAGLVIVSLVFPHYMAAQWTKTDGPPGAICMDKYNRITRVFSVTDTGIYLSTTSGSAWALAGPPLLALSNRYFAIGRTHFYLESDGNIYAAEIGGTVWSLMGFGLSGEDPVWVFTAVGTTLFATKNVTLIWDAELHTSTDHGVVWTTIPNFHSLSIDKVVADETDLYASSHHAGRVQHSSDAGLTWRAIQGFFPDDWNSPVRYLVICGHSLFASCFVSDGGREVSLYVSLTPGSDWIPAASGLPTSNSVPLPIFYITGNGAIFFADNPTKGVYRSFDGINWEPFEVGLPAGVTKSSYLYVTDTHIFVLASDSTGQHFWRMPVEFALPIQLAEFNASQVAMGRSIVSWQTTTETNNYGFEVQKTLNPPHFQTGVNAWVPGQGTTLTRHEYSWTDYTAQPGTYYRLKQIDLDGAVHYSEAVRVGTLADANPAVSGPGQVCLYQNYPNPFNPSTIIRYGLPDRSHVTLTLFNTLGQQVAMLQNGEQEAGYHEVKFDAGGLTSGVYFYQLQCGTLLTTRKFALVR